MSQTTGVTNFRGTVQATEVRGKTLSLKDTVGTAAISLESDAENGGAAMFSFNGNAKFVVGDKVITMSELEAHINDAATLAATVESRIAALEAKTALMDDAQIDE